MRRVLLGAAIAAVFLGCLGCSQEREEGARVLAKINDFELSQEAFDRQLKEEVEFYPEFKVTRKAKSQFLEEIIRKELLIQEAKRRRLDRRAHFVRTIECYWEATLIRDLMQEKSAEIVDKMVVAEEEIEDRYREMKASEPDLSDDPELRKRIRKGLLEDKKNRALEAWVEGLRQGAKIEIDQGLLQGK